MWRPSRWREFPRATEAAASMRSWLRRESVVFRLNLQHLVGNFFVVVFPVLQILREQIGDRLIEGLLIFTLRSMFHQEPDGTPVLVIGRPSDGRVIAVPLDHVGSMVEKDS